VSLGDVSLRQWVIDSRRFEFNVVSLSLRFLEPIAATYRCRNIKQNSQMYNTSASTVYVKAYVIFDDGVSKYPSNDDYVITVSDLCKSFTGGF
jgi:hypothetical protein